MPLMLGQLAVAFREVISTWTPSQPFLIGWKFGELSLVFSLEEPQP